MKMVKRKILKILTIIVLIIGLSNYYSDYINLFTEGIGKRYLFQSESLDFQFTAVPSKGRDTEVMQRCYENHLARNRGKRENIYRTFKKNPYQFWNWYRYSTDELYQYEYRTIDTL